MISAKAPLHLAFSWGGGEAGCRDGEKNIQQPVFAGAENLWTTTGFVNGSIGTIEDMGWEERLSGINPRRIPPTVLAVRFESYSGPP